MNYASLGTVTFDLLAWSGHKEENTYVFAKIATAKAPSILQSMGTELRSIPATVQWHADWCSDPNAEYEAFKALAALCSSQKLLIGNKVIGDFVIEKITGENIKTLGDGTPICIGCDFNLTEYIEKTLQTRKSKKKKNRPGVKTSSSTSTAGTAKEYKSVPIKSTDPNMPPFSRIEAVTYGNSHGN